MCTHFFLNLPCNLRFSLIFMNIQIPGNSVESEHGCTSRIYFDNAGDNVTLTLYNVTLTTQKPCLHNNKCDCSKTNSLNEIYVFSIKYNYSDI